MAARPLVSVVIPAYNAEMKITETLRSIIAQDYPNLEVIVVNDASTDGTRAAALAALEGCGRLWRVLDHGQNRGVSAARNTGMEAAAGEYLWFIDADDMAERNLVSALYSLIEEYNCDIAFCGLLDRFEDGWPDAPHPVRLRGPRLRTGEELTRLRALRKIAPHVCGMLFRKGFLQDAGLHFHEGCAAGEDVEFQLKVLCRAQTAAFTPDCLYIYRLHAQMGSIRDNDTGGKKLNRYRDNTEAQLRAAECLMAQAPSEGVKKISQGLLLPRALIRRFTLLAREGDREGFDALLADAGVRRGLWASRAFALRVPEVFLKALCLLWLPGLYYRLRRG